ncbi:hypothetical protein QR97_14845 [Streptomyces sp. PBH53]|uniref:glutamate-cysteine ligase family protein n=1 Tax=Streptomyces sp. PBH53 TaxID=1577075 RepID=UPI0006554FA5|nr:glutamate-cysteine ligase family protein [Streptomyces sp. PBH53]AKN70920.1 hypothetical protein QR97_14845 [Streptomyces sp. PBH53]
MSIASAAPSLSPAELRSVFERNTQDELVGIEIESAALDPRTGRSIPYAGESGIGAYLAFLASQPGVEAVHDYGTLVGVRLPDGGQVSLEHGGAVEYSSPPAPCVADLMDLVHAALRRLAAAADRFGFALVPGRSTRARPSRTSSGCRTPVRRSCAATSRAWAGTACGARGSCP